MSRKALFADLLADVPDLKADLAKVAVAADLTVLLTQSGLTRTELAKRMGWSKARVTQVLSGEGNLTIETLHAVGHALGHTFDIVFRKQDERRLPQRWERGMVKSLEGDLKPLKFPVQGAGARSTNIWLVKHKTAQKVVHDELNASAEPLEWAHAA